MTDTKEFNKSLDRIAKALGGEEWSPEDKPEAIYKLLDKIADKLEESTPVGPLIVHGTEDNIGNITLDTKFGVIKQALEDGRQVIWEDDRYFNQEHNVGTKYYFNAYEYFYNPGSEHYVYTVFFGSSAPNSSHAFNNPEPYEIETLLDTYPIFYL